MSLAVNLGNMKDTFPKILGDRSCVYNYTQHIFEGRGGVPGAIEDGGMTWVRMCGQKVHLQWFTPLGQTPYKHSVGFANVNCEEVADHNKIFTKSTTHVIVLPFLGGLSHEGCFPFSLRSLLHHLSATVGTRSNAKNVTNMNNDT